jgi:hypothetical protein
MEPEEAGHLQLRGSGNDSTEASQRAKFLVHPLNQQSDGNDTMCLYLELELLFESFVVH